MALDSIVPLTIAALLLGLIGALMMRSSHGAHARLALCDAGAGFGATAIGLVTLVAAPDAVTSPVRVIGNAALMFGIGLVWASAQRFGRGTAPRPTAVAAGALGWLALNLVLAPTLGWRIGISSIVLAAYSVAAAHALLRGPSRAIAARRRCGAVLAAHGAFQVLRAALGASFGLAAWGPGRSPAWGGAFAVEVMLFALLFGASAIAMSRPGAAEANRRDEPEDGLEDTLTGVGNHRALFNSGAVLLAEADAANRPLALLTMDLDGFKVVNQRHGPAAGDRLLVAFARLAHDYLPQTSLVCRIGGDAFAAVLPGAHAERARAVADELRSLFAYLALDGEDGPVAATVSIGVAEARPGQAALSELLGAANRCLSIAKLAGRDRVVDEADPIAGAMLPAA